MTTQPTDLHLHLTVSDKGKHVHATLSDPLAEGGPQAQDWPEPEQPCGLAQIPPALVRQAGRLGSTKPIARGVFEAFGEALYKLLFDHEYDRRLRDTLNRLTGSGRRLRLSLSLDEAGDPFFASLPWELLRAPAIPGEPAITLALDARLVLARRRSAWSHPPLQRADPLRIQLVVSDVDPEGLGPVDGEEVHKALEALAAEHPGQVVLLPLETAPSRQRLDDLLKEGKPHILHVVAHGMLAEGDAARAQLALFDQVVKGAVDWVTGEDFCKVFARHLPQMVFLQACQGGAQDSTDALNGVASQVVQHGVPVVVAMQYPITNAAAGIFARRVYAGLGRFEAVDAAVQEGRGLLQQTYPNTLLYAIPVLHMRPADGRLFLPAPDQAPPPPSDSQQIRRLQAALANPLAVACAALDAASESLAEFAALDHLLTNLVRYLGAIAFSLHWQTLQGSNDALREWLERVMDGELADWVTLIQDAARLAQSQPPGPLWAQLYAPWLETVGPASALNRAAAEAASLRYRPPLSAPPSPGDVLGGLVALRDETWGENPASAAQALRERLAPALRPALLELLARFEALLTLPLLLVTDTAERDGCLLCRGLRCQGASQPFADLDAALCLPMPPRPYKAGRVYLGLPGPGGETAELLQLDPLLVAQRESLYFLANNRRAAEIRFKPVGQGRQFKIEREFASAMKSMLRRPAARYEDAEVNKEMLLTRLEQHVQRARLRDASLQQLFAYLDDGAQDCLRDGLGEALRIGRFWLGLEFVLMGMTRQKTGALRDWLAQNRLSRTELRGALRGLVGIDDRDWKKNPPVEELGAKALPDLRLVTPAALAAELSASPPPRPHVLLTERVYHLILDAIQLAGGEEKPGAVSADHLLLALLRLEEHPLVQLLAQPLFLGKLRQHLAWQLGDKQPGDAEAGELAGAAVGAPAAVVLAAVVPPGAAAEAQAAAARLDPRQAPALEQAARQELEGLLAALLEKLAGQLGGLSLTEGAWELLCSPFWASARRGLEPRPAWLALVAEPLVTDLESGGFPPGARLRGERRGRDDGSFDIRFTLVEDNA